MNTLAVLLTSENLQYCPCQSLSASANQIPRQLPIRMGERGEGKKGKGRGGEREEEVKEGGGKGEEEVKEGGGEGKEEGKEGGRGKRSDVGR